MPKFPNLPTKLIDLIVFLAGGLLVFAFSPFYFSFLAFISLACLFASWVSCTPKRAAWRGFLFGVSSFGLGVSWVFVSINTYGNTNIFVSTSITALFVFGLSLFPALTGYLSSKLLQRSPQSRSYLRLAVIFPSIWVLIDLLRGWIFTGFPWLYIGYTQTNTFIGGLAAIGSVYLVSLITALLSTLLVIVFIAPRLKHKICVLVIGLLILDSSYLLDNITWTKPLQQKPTSVTLVQGNVPQLMKWNPNAAEDILNTYYHLTKNNMSSLIFWPENALPLFAQQIGSYLESVDALADTHHAALITGIPVTHDEGKAYYNGAMVLGEGHGEYLKHHLVPFGEYLPLKGLIGPVLQFMHIPMSNFSAGPLHQPLLHMNNVKVALSICYESAYPNQIRIQSKRSNLMAVISDDAWFGNSFGPWQHLQMAQMRAIENGRYLVQATNDGITAIINNHGEVIKEIPQFKPMVLKGQVLLFKGQTPWQRYGMTPLIMLLLFMLLLAMLYRRTP
ncbi:apolipoprotein N-acyltransferase [Francisellaceae bacterium]|nr:apolipoprotein N-acyltransferase [Francisellaceae bacterium]